MKLWHLIAIGGVAYLLLRKKTPAVAAPAAPVPGAYDARAVQEAAAAAAAAAGASVPGVPSGDVPLPLYGISWAGA
jgi:hypothetical protein